MISVSSAISAVKKRVKNAKIENCPPFWANNKE